jgi:hypothetical protein
VGQPFTPAYNQAVHYRRTRRPAYERQQIKPMPIPIIDEITGPPEFRDPVEYLDHGPWPYRHMADLKAWLLLNPVAGSRRVGSPMTTLTITGKVPPPVTIANASPSNGLGLRSALLESFVSIRIKRNAGVAGAIVADVSRSPVRSGVMLTPSRRVTPN